LVTFSAATDVMTLVEGEQVRGSIDPGSGSVNDRPVWKEYRVLIEEPVEILEVHAEADDPDDAELFLVADVSRAAHDPRAYRWKSEQERSPSMKMSTSAAHASDLIHLADETLPVFLHVAVAAKRPSASGKRVDYHIVATRSQVTPTDVRTEEDIEKAAEQGVAEPDADAETPGAPTQLREGDTAKITLPDGPDDVHIFKYDVQKPDQPVVLSVATYAGSTNFTISASPTFDAPVYGPARNVMYLPPTNPVVKKALTLADAESKEGGERQKPCIYIRVVPAHPVQGSGGTNSIGVLGHAAREEIALQSGQPAEGVVVPGQYDRYKLWVQGDEEDPVEEVEVTLTPITGDPDVFVSFSSPFPMREPEHHDFKGDLDGGEAVRSHRIHICCTCSSFRKRSSCHV
jgi:hypothetical protein